MIRPYLGKIILATCGVLLSAWLTEYVAGSGSYVLDYVFGPSAQPRNLRDVLLVWFSTDFILTFSILDGAVLARY